MSARLLSRRQVPDVRRLGRAPVVLGLEVGQNYEEDEGARPGPHRLRVAPSRDIQSRNMFLGWHHQVLGLRGLKKKERKKEEMGNGMNGVGA